MEGAASLKLPIIAILRLPIVGLAVPRIAAPRLASSLRALVAASFAISLAAAKVEAQQPVSSLAPQGIWFEQPLVENFAIFSGLEGSKQPQDFGVNAHFGGRVAANGALPLWREWGLGIQLGTSLNATSNAVQVVERVEGSTGRTQSFTTIGIFQRLDSGWLWAVGYDHLFQDYYDDFGLGQVRGRVGYRIFPDDEVGFQGALHTTDSSGNFGPVPVTLRSLDQGSFYYRHWFANRAMLGIWAGAAQSHGEVNVALGDLPRTGTEFVFGSDLHIPLTDRLALYGEANFILPADTGTVDAFLGLEFRFFGGQLANGRNRFAPLLPVANNTTFSTDLRR